MGGRGNEVEGWMKWKGGWVEGGMRWKGGWGGRVDEVEGWKGE